MTIQAAAANPEAIFTFGVPHLNFGPGASNVIGFDRAQWRSGVSRRNQSRCHRDQHAAADDQACQCRAGAPDAVLTLGRERHREIPNGARVIGSTRADTADLVERPMKHHWPLVICPKQITEEDIAQIFEVTKEML